MALSRINQRLIQKAKYDAALRGHEVDFDSEEIDPVKLSAEQEAASKRALQETLERKRMEYQARA